MSHVRRFSESSVSDIKSESSPANYYSLWVTKHPSGPRTVRVSRSSFDFGLRAGKGGLRSLGIGSFLCPTLEEEEMSGSGDETGLVESEKTDDTAHSDDQCLKSIDGDDQLRKADVTAPSPRLAIPHPRSTTGLKVLIKRLSLSLLRTRSFTRTRPEPELPIIHSLNHHGPSRLDPHALVFGDENPERIEQRSLEFYQAFFPSLILE
ncbi:hypothetical protein PGT21_026433 [Puccinia graminis f. sp. tritici]|uniref:Uncharacterized protein n=1 Tax=Puccinia graminis f. sp. tritici TaxID=56615 RepID=A0A5B0QPR3_PUCGR|nr:hypothetical protein PGT21_026433 [Puccinia graminis f. sp. tritici]